MSKNITPELKPTHVLGAGCGYYDVTSYPYGGCFRRANEDTPVTLVPGRGQYGDEVRVVFADKRAGIVRSAALRQIVTIESLAGGYYDDADSWPEVN